ncbi:hypothetical protein [Sphingobium boeckii]|uniref:Uncharacterized protein n=1 Tax=Sphingobium boeckii TaxID=1082345 RepID=A0A7W9AJC6_9SPHN|nr:hypothetical protein [Sphingobium boeckii]MBB5686623.1 hypothetical protein [Sphingobium boeckii]
MWNLLVPGQAMADTTFSADVSAGINTSTNPYLFDGGDTSSVSATVSVSPTVTVKDEAGEFRLTGSLQHEEFFNRYPSAQNYALNAGYDRRLSSELSFSAGAGFRSSVSNANQLLNDPLGGGIIDPTLPPVLEDITLNGLRQRQTSFQTRAGFALRTSALDQFTLDYSGAFTRYPSNSNFLNDYDFFGQTLAYSRTLNSRTSVGASVGVSRSNYRGISQGDGIIISPQLTASTKLAARWSLSGSIGTSITRTNTLTRKITATTLAGSLSACRAGERSNLCLTGSRAATPTAFGGIRAQTAMGASYSYRVDEKSDISASANYSMASEPLFDTTVPGQTGRSVDFVSTSVTINRKINQRLSGFISGGYSESFEKLLNQRANFQVSAGIRLLIGDRR